MILKADKMGLKSKETQGQLDTGRNPQATHCYFNDYFRLARKKLIIKKRKKFTFNFSSCSLDFSMSDSHC